MTIVWGKNYFFLFVFSDSEYPHENLLGNRPKAIAKGRLEQQASFSNWKFSIKTKPSSEFLLPEQCNKKRRYGSLHISFERCCSSDKQNLSLLRSFADEVGLLPAVASLPVLLPLIVVQVGEVREASDVVQVHRETRKLSICVAVLVRFLERSNLESVLGIHQKVSSQIVKHDRVLRSKNGELAPNHAQRFYLKE